MTQILVGTIPNDGTGDPLRTAFQKINQYGQLNSKTVNAEAYKTSSNTNEAAITLAIAAAALLGTGAAVWVPQSMLPYNAALVTFNTAVKMIREGGNPSIHDPQAYGAAGNAVITARASGAGTKATITGQDDTIALQSCINAGAANLEEVILPPNAFKITAMLTLPSNSQIIGSGWNSQICPDWFDAQAGQSGGQAYFQNADTTNGNDNIVLSNFYLNASGPGTPTANGLTNGAAAGILIRGTSSGLGGCHDIAIKNMKFTNTPGITIAYQGCQRIQITGNLVHDVGKDGITGAWFNGANLTDVLVQGNIIYNCGDDSIAVLASISNNFNATARPSRIAILGNVIRDSQVSNFAARGIMVAGCENVAITGNVIHNTFASGINVEWDTQVAGGSLFSSRYITVSGNTVTDGGRQGNGSQPQHGMRFTGCASLTVTGNTVIHASQSGILVTDNTTAAGACADIELVGNTVTGNGTTAATDTAILATAGLANGIQRLTVTGNLVSGNVSGGIGIQAANWVLVAMNQCMNNGTAGGHTEPECGIWVWSAGAAGLSMVIRDNLCTDNQGGKTQTTGITVRAHATLIASLTLQDNFLQGNFSSGLNSEVILNAAPTLYIYRRDDPTPFVLTDAATIAVDARLGSNARVTLLASGHAMGAPTNPSSGQRITFTIIQDGTGGRALTWNASYKLTWSDTGNTLNKRSSISCIYDGTNWNQDGAQTPYV